MATIYISPAGNDTTGTGTSGNPYQTIAKFLAVSSSGDTCQLAAGTYSWVAHQDVSNRSFVGASPLTTIIDAANSYVEWKAQGTVNLTNLKFYRNNSEDAVSTYGNVSCRGVFVPSGSSAVTWNFTNCILDTFVVTGSYDGLGGMFSSTTVIIGSYGTDHANSTFNLTGCLFLRIAGNSVSAQPSVLFSANCTVTNCTFYFTESTTPLDGINNIGKTAVIKNCIFQDAGTAFAFGSATVTYSCMNGFSSVPSGTGNITSDPLFVDKTNGNFNLRPTSPCIDSATLV